MSTRLLRSHVTTPGGGFLRGQATRPGGITVIEDVDSHSCFSWPRGAVVDRYAELYKETGLRLGADPLIRPKLVGMFVDAALLGSDVTPKMTTLVSRKTGQSFWLVLDSPISAVGGE